jgi:hypothetical protein
MERPPTPAALNRTLTEKFGPAPEPPRPPREARLGRLAAAARRLAEACAGEGTAVPRPVLAHAEALAEELAALADRS